MNWWEALLFTFVGSVMGYVTYSVISSVSKSNKQSEISFDRHNKCKVIYMTNKDIIETLQEISCAVDYSVKSDEDFERYTCALGFAIELIKKENRNDRR